MDPEPDPGGPKTYGSDGSGFGSATGSLRSEQRNSETSGAFRLRSTHFVNISILSRATVSLTKVVPYLKKVAKGGEEVKSKKTK